MVKFFMNNWTRRVVSLSTVIYLLFMVGIAYNSIFYKIGVENVKKTAIVISALSIIMIILCYYTRKQIFTRLISLLQLPILFPIVVLNLSHYEIIIPIAITSILMFFITKVGEGVKTVYGAFMLMYYLIGSIGYYVFANLMFPPANAVIAQSGVSACGEYRYTVQNISDHENGSTKVIIEPNYMDVDYDIYYGLERGYSETVFLTRPQAELEIRWETEKREDIIKELVKINPDVSFTLSEVSIAKIEDMETYSQIVLADDLSGKQLIALGFEPDIDSQTELKLGYSDLQRIGYAVSKKYKLSELTDIQLSALGVPMQGDVMYVNGEPTFRYLVAILERTFESENWNFSFH